jgi:HPt (histidine-containing phosphotransfer) domain-containing protein
LPVREADTGGKVAQKWRNSGDRLKRSINHCCDCLTVIPGIGRSEPRVITGVAMSRHMERLNWMPSPPLVPEDSPIDVQHLGRMTLGEPDLEIEVLALFSAQSHDLIARLASMPVDAAALVHTLKGSARAIGAFRVADAALELETVMRNNGNLADALSTLQDAVAEARATIDRMLNRS